MGLFGGGNHFDVDGRTVVITGGSQGMGRGLARLLAQKGANVVIVARNEAKLAEAFKYISSAAKNPATQRFNAISADVTKPEENQRIIDEVTSWNNGQPPDIVWANAGGAYPALFVDTPLETLRSQMDLNYWAAAYLAQATLKAWLKPSSGPKSDKAGGSGKADSEGKRHFIMTSTTACFVGVAGYGPYAAPKAAMRSLADTLHSEVNLYNGARRGQHGGPAADIAVHLVCPGGIKSPGWENEEKTKHEITKILEKDDPQQTEDEVAAAAVSGLEKGGYIVTTQFLGHAMRASMLGGSARNNWFVDTVFSWVTAVVWLFVGPDLDGKVWKYGKKNGMGN